MEYPQKVAFPKYASVVVDLAINKPLDYGIAMEQIPLVKEGVRVNVRVKGHMRTGYVIAIKEKVSLAKVLPIHTVHPEEERLQKDLLELALWMARYYGASLGQVLKSIVPSKVRQPTQPKQQQWVGRSKTKPELQKIAAKLRLSHPSQARVLDLLLKAREGMLLTELLDKGKMSKSPVETLVKKGCLFLSKVSLHRSPLVGEEYFKTKPKALNQEQQAAYDKMAASLSLRRFETHLLFGITGSGKTEVYLRIIEQALNEGLSTLMLLPEIALTPQMVERFRARFDHRVGVIHHRLSQSERYDEWSRIRRQETKIVIGARSALFCPIQDLGLIIVDEEHDGAYKQDAEPPSYQARDVAVMRGKLNQCVVVLGTATPSLESFYNAQKGKYTLSKLSCRPTRSTLPKVTIVDMKKEIEKAGQFTNFSEPLIEGIKTRLKQGEQTLLFLNRRGYHTSRQCGVCGHIFKCPHCDLALTFHLGENRLACHLCGYQLAAASKICPQCHGHDTLKYRGVGTQQIERALYALFPDVRALRIDGDTTRHKGSHERLFRQFKTGKADVLIGTQMIAKGLDFPAVTLVAVLNTDAGLHIPDFRASEHVFQLMTQVAGRAGRGQLPGEVIFQTQMPDNSTIRLAAQQDYEAFFQTEIKTRELFHFPPFTHLVKLTFMGKEAHLTQQIGERIRHFLVKKLEKSFTIHPLVASGYAKIKGWFRFQCLIRGPVIYPVHSALKQLLAHYPLPKEVKMHIDVDPHSTFF
ncbi:MAG: primosomal protein N' [Chlamydiales bacterium]